ncbi:MAG: hypothetical protein GYA62_17365, partial [Bacteroidales bacterium]|nr:hypothetical protein [Bacteroidales bacterium]
MPIPFRKILFSILSFLLFFFVLIPNINAVKAADDQGLWYNQSFFSWYHKVYDDSNQNEIFGERYTAAQVQWIVYSIISLPLNMDPDTQKVVACFLGVIGGSTDADTCGSALVERFNSFSDFFNSVNKTSGLNKNSTLTSIIFDTTKRPISGIGYTKHLITNFSPVKTAYAQGFGYSALSPIQKYWSGFRNIAYSLIVLVVIVFAFMIMFRVKISPQLVISVQTALPKIITAAILVTFSYAISGFMVDLMYVVAGIFASLLVTAGFMNNISQAYLSIIPVGNNTGLWLTLNMIVYDIAFVLSVIVNLVMGIFSITSILPVFIFTIIGVLLIVWILILSIWYTFKASWVLIKTLISVYIAIITSPIQFVMGAFVSSMSFGNWFKRLLADILVFPVTGLVLLFAWMLLGSSFNFAVLGPFSNGTIGQQIMEWFGKNIGINMPANAGLWSPEIISFAGPTAGFLWLFASFACITILPKVPDM